MRKGEIEIEYISTELMVADPLTKPVRPIIFHKYVGYMGISESFNVLSYWEFDICDQMLTLSNFIF